MKYITIKDIARHLSISVSTVSRALGDDKNIRKETKEKVIEAFCLNWQAALSELFQ